MEFRKSDQSVNDVVLIVDEERFKCHKDVISGASEYFRAMFSHAGFVESQASEVEIHDVTGAHLKTLLEFAYKNDLSIPSALRDIHELLHAAALFQFDAVQRVLVSHLLETLTVDTCLDNLRVAEALAIKDLRDRSKMVALWEFFYREPDLPSLLSVRELPFEVLGRLLADTRMRTSNGDYSVLICIVVWTEHNAFDDDQLRELIRVVRPSKLTPEDFIRLKSNSFINTMKQLPIIERIQKHCERSPGFVEIRRKPPLKPLLFTYDQNNARILFNLISSQDGNDVAKVIDSFPLSKIDVANVTGLTVTAVGKDLYFLAGREYYGSGSWNTNLWQYDSFSRSYCRLSDIPRKLRHVKCACDENFIYIAGGFGAFRVLTNSLFRYDIREDRWLELPELPFPCSNAFTIALRGGVLYVFSFGSGIFQLDDRPTPLWRKIGQSSGLQGALISAATEKEIFVFSSQEDAYVIFNPELGGITGKFNFNSGVSWDYCLLVHEEIFLFDTNGRSMLVYDLESDTLKRETSLSVITNFVPPTIIPFYLPE